MELGTSFEVSEGGREGGKERGREGGRKREREAGSDGEEEKETVGETEDGGLACGESHFNIVLS